MRTILLTLVSGIFICLITSIGKSTDIEFTNHPTHYLEQDNYTSDEEYSLIEPSTINFKTDVIYDTVYCNTCINNGNLCSLDCEIKSLSEQLLGTNQKGSIINPDDITVDELSYDIELLELGL